MTAVQPFFSPRTHPEEKQNKIIAECVRRDLLPREKLAGYVYIAKEADTGFCKVGWAKKDHARRIRAIGKCQIVSNGSYKIGSFVGAFRAEQLVHKLLLHCRHRRKNCPCGCQNREWYKIDYQELKYLVLTVFSWLRVDPYDTVEKKYKLKPTWEDALERWEATQETETPREWDDFFINGPSLETVDVGLRNRTSPKSLPPRQPSTTKYVDRTVLKVGRSHMKKIFKRGLIKFQRHSTDHGRGQASVPRASKVRSLLKEQSTAETFRDWEPADEMPDPTPTKPPQSRQRSTWDHRMAPRDQKLTDTTVSQTATPTQKITFINTDCEGPSCGYTEALDSTWSATSGDRSQRAPPLPQLKQVSKSTPGHTKDHDGGASYYFQTVLDAPVEGDQSEVERGRSDLGRREHGPRRSDRAILDIAVLLARMPGAFPDEEIEETSSTNLNMSEVQEQAGTSNENGWYGDISEQGHLTVEDAPGAGDCAGRRTTSVEVVSSRAPIDDELGSKAAPCVSSDTPCAPVTTSALTSEIGNALAAAESTMDGAAQNGNVADTATVQGFDNSNKAPPAVPISETAAGGIRGQSSRVTLFNLGQASSKTSNHSVSCLPPVVQPLPYSGGTGVLPFVPVVKWDPSPEAYQSISCMVWYSRYSFEELRLADYLAGRHFAYKDAAEVSVESSYESTEEYSSYESTEAEFSYESTEEESSHESTEEESSHESTEEGQLRAFNDWSDEPSEDDSADETWTCETDNENQETREDEEPSTQERQSKFESNASLPNSRMDMSAAAPLSIQIAKTAVPNPPPGSLSSKELSAFTFQFGSTALNVNPPRFHFTRPFLSRPKSSSTTKHSVPGSNVFGDVFIGSPLRFTRPNRETVPVKTASPEIDSAVESNNASNSTISSEGSDQNGITPARIQPLNTLRKRNDSAIDLAGQITRKIDECDCSSESQQCNRSIAERSILATKNEPHQGNNEEAYDADVSDMAEDVSDRYIPSTGFARVADGRLDRENRGRGPFREKVFLLHTWSFDVG